MRWNVGSAIFLLAIMMGPVFSQANKEPRPAFEVASIKPNGSGSQSSSTSTRDGGYLSATNVTLKQLIMQSYGLQDFQISGGPDWINTVRFDIQARAMEGAVQPRTDAQDPTRPSTMQLMMQSLLEERFQFRSHAETQRTARLRSDYRQRRIEVESGRRRDAI